VDSDVFVSVLVGVTVLIFAGDDSGRNVSAASIVAAALVAAIPGDAVDKSELSEILTASKAAKVAATAESTVA